MNIRREVQQALNHQDAEKIIACFEENDASTSRYLQMYVFGLPSDPMRWCAIDYLGLLAERYAQDRDLLFRNIIRRFIWQMCEEGGNVPWASPEIVGSIIANVPGRRFEEFIGPLFYHTDLNDICYAGLYWVLPQLMTHHAEKVEEYLPNTYYWFDRYDMADLRAYAAIYFAQYPHAEMNERLAAWRDDYRTATLYIDGQIVEKRISDLV